MKQLQKQSSEPSTPSKLPPLPIATPITARAVRRLVKSSPSRQKEALLERAVMRLVTKYEIQSFENRGLRHAITQEKKRRHRGKRLNLLGEEASNMPQFFSPERVLAARAYQETKEAAEQEEKRQKAIRKEEAAHQRQQVQAEKQKAALQRQLRQKASREAKAKDKAQKAAERDAKRRQKEQEKQEKAQAAAQRKKEQDFCRQVAAAAKAAAASKGSARSVIAGGKKARQKRAKPASKAVRVAAGSQRAALPQNQAPFASPAVAVAAAAVGGRKS